MIDAADDEVTSWLEQAAQVAPTWLAPPKAPPGPSGVALHLLGISEAPAPRAPRQTPLQVRLQYLVFPWDADPKTEHRRLGTLLASALHRHDWQVDLSSVSLPLWQALGLPPRAAFTLLVPLRIEEPLKLAAPVTRPLRLRQVPAATLRGRVVAGKMPIAAARVELPVFHEATETDADGNFAFGLLPASDDKRTIRHRVRVNARGKVHDLDLEAPASGRLIIDLNNQED